MKNPLISSYLILWMHLINFTFRLFNELNDFEIIKLDMGNLNTFLNDTFSLNYEFDNGVINILTLINAITSFCLGKYYNNSLIILNISTLIIELVFIYNDKEGKLFNSILIINLFYLLGRLTRKNKNTYILEKSFNENIYDEINIQEYEPYKLY